MALLLEKDIVPSASSDTNLIHDNFSRKEHFIEIFLNKRIKNLNTRKAYHLNIKEFFNVSNVIDITLNDIRKVTIFDVEDWISYMKDYQYSSATINRKIASLSSLYNWLLKYQDNSSGIRILQFNPFAAISDEKPKTNNKITQFLTTEELNTVLNNLDTSTLHGFRNKLFILLIVTTGLRKSEAINIKIKDISSYNQFDIIKILGKGNKLDIVKIQPKVKELIDIYLKKTNRDYSLSKDKYLFINHSSNSRDLGDTPLDASTINKMIKKICKKSGITKNITVHSLRHTAITLAIESGYTIEKVRDFARHSNLSTTNRYIHSMNNLKENPGDKIMDLIHS